MTDLYTDCHPLANMAQIFEITISNSYPEETEDSISTDLWKLCFDQFKWLSYRNKILQCLACQSAYQKYPSDFEPDEWTTPNLFNFQCINRDNLIIILKLHNFSDNHIRASELLNEASETENENSCSLEKSFHSNSENSSLNFVNLLMKQTGFNYHSTNMELLRSFAKKHFQKFHKTDITLEYVIDLCSESAEYPIANGSRLDSLSPWCRYLARYPWLYLKDDNPGCKYCEQAFKLSLQMSFTKWTSPNVLAETVSQDRPNRTLLQHDRSKNHRIAEDVLVEHKIITPPRSSPQSKVEIMPEENLGGNLHENLFEVAEYPPGFSVDRWDKFTKNYRWLYYRDRLYRCWYCERAYESHRGRMTRTSWTSAQFGSGRIKNVLKARHHFYEHQRSSNHRVARDALQLEEEDEDEAKEVDEDDPPATTESKSPGPLRPLSPLEDDGQVLSEKQWHQLRAKYGWLEGAVGRSYGCRVCQTGRKLSPLSVNLSQWTQGTIALTKTKYVQLRKSLWCHSVTRNHINSAAALALLPIHDSSSLLTPLLDLSSPPS